MPDTTQLFSHQDRKANQGRKSTFSSLLSNNNRSKPARAALPEGRKPTFSFRPSMKRFAHSSPVAATADEGGPSAPHSPPPKLQRFASSVSDLVKRIRGAHPDLATRNPWKESYVGSTLNLKQSRDHAKHRALRPMLRPKASRALATAQDLSNAKPAIKSTSELREILEGLNAWADAKEGTVQPPSNFRDRFAERLVDLKLKPETLLKQWDANGDGKLSPVEFRMQVRLLGFTAEQVTVFEIDELFRDLDADSSMFLKLHELRAVLQRMEDGVRQQRQREQRASEAAARLREAASLMDFAIKRTAALDIECDKLDRHASGELMTLDQRLGRHMTLRNAKLNDVGIVWAERATFKQSVRGFEGVVGPDDDAALDALFTSFDTSCRGKLELPEMRRALTRLQKAAAIAAADHSDQVVVVQEVRSQVVAAQGKALNACASLRDLLAEKDELLAESFSQHRHSSEPREKIRAAAYGPRAGQPQVSRAKAMRSGPSMVQPPWKNVNTT